MAEAGLTESPQHSYIAGRLTRFLSSVVLFAALALPKSLLGGTIPYGAAPLAPPEVIDTILIKGNRTTQPFVILSEIKLAPGETADSLSLREDQERLESLGIFSHAELTILRLMDGTTALMIDVTELWYIWPGIYLAVDEQSPDRVSYGGILSNSNFRGRRENLSINARVGYTQGGEFSWSIPYLSSTHPDWSMKLAFANLTEKEPRYLRDREGIEVEDISGTLNFAHRFNLENSISLRARVSNRAFRSTTDNAVLTPEIAGGGSSATTGEFSLGFRRDTRTYRPWPTRGYYFRADINTSQALDSRKISFFQPQFQTGFVFTPLQPIHIAMRVGAATLLGEAPLYRQYLLNKDNGVRTAADASYEGSWRITSSMEFRGDIIPIGYATFPIHKSIQRYTRNLRLGLSSVIFVDGGAVGGAQTSSSDRPELQQTDGWEVAYGAGLVFHVPYHDIIRLELSRSARFPSDGLLLRMRVGISF